MAEEEKKELPPIVMVEEAVLIEKKLEPAYQELYGTLGKDVLTLDKAQTKALIDKVVNREGEEIKEEEMTALFEQMPKHEEDKEPVLIADAKECALRYFVTKGMIPTRLKTALKNYSDE